MMLEAFLPERTKRRKTLGTNERDKVEYLVRCTRAERDALGKAARAYGCSRAAIIRAALALIVEEMGSSSDQPTEERSERRTATEP